MISKKIKVTFNEDVLGTTPGDPELYETYIGKNAPDAKSLSEEIEALGIDQVFEKGITVFARDKDGNPICWDYQWKGYFKDSFKGLRNIPGTACSNVKAYKQLIDKQIFIAPRMIPYQLSDAMGICQRPLRASTPKGEMVALACSEVVPAGSSMIFTIHLTIDSLEKAVDEALDYGALCGFGQWRNSGKGRFTWEELEREVRVYDPKVIVFN